MIIFLSRHKAQANQRPGRSLLSPIGEYASQHVNPAKGKREKKRKRKDRHAAEEPSQDGLEEANRRVNSPEMPAIKNYLTIGFNSTTRYLEALAQISAPQREGQDAGPSKTPHSRTAPIPKPLAAIFVPRFDQPSILHSNLPLLIEAASLASPSSPQPSLVTLPKGADERLSAAIAIPRVGLIGLLDGAPNADLIINFIRQHVPKVEVPWLDEAARGLYRPVNIKAVETNVPVEKKARLS